MVSQLEKNKCTGCGVCVDVCPVKCIALMPDSEGFVYPVIDKARCTSCDMCDESCHAQHVVKSNSGDPEALVAYNKDEKDRLSSSSGGIFIALARQTISENGLVYGAALDSDMRVCHVRIDSMHDLHRLQGSKYVQSYIDPAIYTIVKADLGAGRPVLYSGTPCQIGALRRFLVSVPDNLTTVSFICHGVPSPLVWEKYIAWQEEQNGSKVCKASFRNKDNGWVNFSMKLHFENGKSYCKRNADDPYLQVFLKNTCLRPSCYSCQYKGKQALSCIDIMLADKWGAVSGDLPNISDDKGISVVLLQNDKAFSLWNKISEKLCFAQTSYTQVINSNISYKVPAVASKYRGVFFEKIDEFSFVQLYNIYAKTPLGEKLKRNAFRTIYEAAKKIGVVAFIKRLRNKIR